MENKHWKVYKVHGTKKEPWSLKYVSNKEEEEKLLQELKDKNRTYELWEDNSGNQSGSAGDATAEQNTTASITDQNILDEDTDSKSENGSSEYPKSTKKGKYGLDYGEEGCVEVPQSPQDKNQIEHLNRGEIVLDKRMLSIINGKTEAKTENQKRLKQMFTEDYMTHLAWQTKTSPDDNIWEEGQVFKLSTSTGKYDEDLIYGLKNELTVSTKLDEIKLEGDGMKKDHPWFTHPSEKKLNDLLSYEFKKKEEEKTTAKLEQPGISFEIAPIVKEETDRWYNPFGDHTWSEVDPLGTGGLNILGGYSFPLQSKEDYLKENYFL